MGGTTSVFGLDSNALNCIRLIKFDDFKALGSFPRYPENKDIVVPLMKFSADEYSKSLIIFISHCWLRGWSGAEGWDGRPHPDNAEGKKYQLCVTGIENIKSSMASEMENCYIWLDYGCIDQDGNPAGELKMLDKIVQICDCIFTPVFESNPESWKLPPFITNMYEEYNSPGWVGFPQAYLNRGWCRVEMFYAANVPLFDANDETRFGKFEAGLAFHQKDGHRPHFVYGSYDKLHMRNPFIMAPLQNSWFERYHPEKGYLTKDDDRLIIHQLVENLKPYMKTIKVGYVGAKNANGKKEGYGVWYYENGDLYEGNWANDVKEGYGKYVYCDGDVYEGGWHLGKRHGKGKFTYLNGNFYDGDWIAGKKQGKGLYIFTTGDTYEGDWYMDNMHGTGTYTYSNGDIYTGGYENDKREGFAVYTFADGTIEEGNWHEGQEVE